MPKSVLALTAALWLAASGVHAADKTFTAKFDKAVSTTHWAMKDIAPNIPDDWSSYKFLVFEMKATSSQRFELGLDGDNGTVTKRIHPRPNVWVRASVPLEFYRNGLGDGNDLAATVNKPHDSYWINIEAGGHGPMNHVTGLTVTARYPVPGAQLEIRNLHLEKTDPGDAILDGKPIVDRFGQYARVDWPDKIHSDAQLKQEWTAETTALKTTQPPIATDQYGGYADRKAKATGFFRVEKIDGKWWFVDPDGALFYSNGVNGTGPGPGTTIKGRDGYFEALPATAAAAANTPGPNGRAPGVSFHAENLKARYGDAWQAGWAADTYGRLRAWGLNTAYGDVINQSGAPAQKIPYVMTLRLQLGKTIMGMPDVYAPEFEGNIDKAVAQSLDARKDDPWMIGYFIGNEPPWPARESQLVDMVLAGAPSALQEHFKDGLKAGDTPDIRRQLVLDAFAHYLDVVNTAVKRHDPNHLNLGIRFGGTPPMYVTKLTTGFDVYSLNKYRWSPPKDYLDQIYAALGKPILIGEFHIGAPEHGMAPGLVQAENQHERGVAYSYYVENAATLPYVIGQHWFQWVDEPVSGRFDGENYNIGWVDVTDRPYKELVAAAQVSAKRIAAIHAGSLPPTTVLGKASELGSPSDAEKLGNTGIQ